MSKEKAKGLLMQPVLMIIFCARGTLVCTPLHMWLFSLFAKIYFIHNRCAETLAYVLSDSCMFPPSPRLCVSNCPFFLSGSFGECRPTPQALLPGPVHHVTVTSSSGNMMDFVASSIKANFILLLSVFTSKMTVFLEYFIMFMKSYFRRSPINAP